MINSKLFSKDKTFKHKVHVQIKLDSPFALNVILNLNALNEHCYFYKQPKSGAK